MIKAFADTRRTVDSGRCRGVLMNVAALARRHEGGVVIPARMHTIVAALAVQTEIPVLLQGETGTGKGVLAQRIHQLRRRSGNVPMVSMNCATLNSEVAEAMLFGRCRGAYTGANEGSQGAVSEASGGILFLDELHCLSLETQRKLLHLLDEGSYCRVGESTPRRAKFQLIAASNRDLNQLAAEGAFLFDLLMRIQALVLDIPPLRERLDDIPDLIALHLHSKQVDIDADDFDDLVEACQAQTWPGNIRQLYKALDTARFLAEVSGDVRLAPHLSVTSALQPAPALQASRSGDSELSRTPLDEAIQELQQLSGGSIDFETTMCRIEGCLIRHVLGRSSSIQEAMARLNLTRGKLDFKRRKHGLVGPGLMGRDL